MDLLTHPAELRVLGALLEKDITTPEYYPLTLNALTAACNQKSNRDPVVAYDEDLVEEALESLRMKGLARVVSGGHNRVPKHAHSISEKLNLGRRELAVMCELMLRGPQTVGELRNRGSRMYEFSDVDEVETVLRSLAGREPDPMVVQLPHQPGTKEPRWAHLLAGALEVRPAAEPVPAASPVAGRLAALEAEMAQLREELSQVKRQMEDFKRQFE